jgi:hypothetical protein
MANERGQYGQPNPSAPKKSTPWWEIAIGASVFLGAGYLVSRQGNKMMADMQRNIGTRMREVGLKKGMTQAEQDAAWDAYYAKRGLKLDDRGELVSMEKH